VKTKVIGLGNTLLGDDGVGVHVVNELQKMQLPLGVEVLDGGSCGLGLLSLMEGAEQVIIVDALACGQKPGSLVKLAPRQLKLQVREKAPSPHYLSLLQTLELADVLGYRQRVLIIGVAPKNLGPGTRLSPQVQAAIPQVIESILEEL